MTDFSLMLMLFGIALTSFCLVLMLYGIAKILKKIEISLSKIEEHLEDKDNKA